MYQIYKPLKHAVKNVLGEDVARMINLIRKLLKTQL